MEKTHALRKRSFRFMDIPLLFQMFSMLCDVFRAIANLRLISVVLSHLLFISDPRYSNCFTTSIFCPSSNYQPRPKRRSIIAYGKRENARHNKMRRNVRYVFFLAVLRFPNFPGKGTAIFPFFIMFCLALCVRVCVCGGGVSFVLFPWF